MQPAAPAVLGWHTLLPRLILRATHGGRGRLPQGERARDWERAAPAGHVVARMLLPEHAGAALNGFVCSQRASFAQPAAVHAAVALLRNSGAVLRAGMQAPQVWASHLPVGRDTGSQLPVKVSSGTPGLAPNRGGPAPCDRAQFACHVRCPQHKLSIHASRSEEREWMARGMYAPAPCASPLDQATFARRVCQHVTSKQSFNQNQIGYRSCSTGGCQQRRGLYSPK